ncbi:hypothetical protein VTL71DRAFT_6686 [Oculimacula yallundae]|uniref:Uncharacterized protein n=1 Tax=Oculimacula yallundae TaxID=86028 RepID=A0ABR4BXT3_9HELO
MPKGKNYQRQMAHKPVHRELRPPTDDTKAVHGVAFAIEKVQLGSVQATPSAQNIRSRDAKDKVRNAPSGSKLDTRAQIYQSNRTFAQSLHKTSAADSNQRMIGNTRESDRQPDSVTSISDPTNPRTKGRTASSRANLKSQFPKAGSSSFKPRSMSAPTISTPEHDKRNNSPIEFDQAVDLRFKVKRRFYEPLVLLSVLGRNRGSRLDEEATLQEDLETSSLDTVRLRRCFIRSLAYLCDYEKGGDRATAVALESTPQGVVFWLASNRCPDGMSDGGRDRVLEFLDSILGSLEGLQHSKMDLIIEELFLAAIKFSGKRIGEYIFILGREVQWALKFLATSDDERDKDLLKWLSSLLPVLQSPVDACRLCYEIRHSNELQSLQLKASPDTSLADHFQKLRHSIGRLGHSMKAIKAIVVAAVHMPRLLDGFQIRREKSSHSSKPPLVGKLPTLAEIVGRMSSNSDETTRYRESLLEMDQKFDLNLEMKLRDKCSATTWKPRVHAELLLLDLFWTGKLEFVDGDRYIGCSKAACYCCHLYIQSHPGNFVAPAGHNNLWINWRVPDLRDQSTAAIKAREAILGKMLVKIRSAVFTQIDELRRPAKGKADSFTEISSVQAEFRSRQLERVRESDVESELESEAGFESDHFDLLGDDGESKIADEDDWPVVASSSIDKRAEISSSGSTSSDEVGPTIFGDIVEPSDGSGGDESDDGGVLLANF